MKLNKVFAIGLEVLHRLVVYINACGKKIHTHVCLSWRKKLHGEGIRSGRKFIGS